MPKLLLIGDPHLKITRFDLAKQFLKWINSLAVELQPDIVINLGDTFDSHSILRAEVMSEFRSHVDYILSKGMKYYYVLGNHDMYKPNDSKYHALKPLKGLHRDLLIVDERCDIDNLTLVPYIYDHRLFPLDTREICIAHQTFVGADYGYIRPEVGVMAEDVAAEVIISGHIHLKQEFGKVIYPGSPYPQNANDIDQIKGVMLFDTDTYKHEFFACPLPMWRSFKYELSPSLTIKDVHGELAGLLNDRDHFITYIMGPKAEIVGYENSKEFKLLQKNNDVVIKPTFTDREKKLAKIEALSVEKIMSEYIDTVYAGGIDKQLLKSKVLEIVQQANKSQD